MGKIGDLWVRLGLRNEEFKKGMREAETSGKSLGQKLQANWRAVAGGVAAAVVAVKGFVNAYKKIAEFEQANANLATILGKSVNDIKNMTQSAQELGRTTAFTASQVTGLQTELAKLGFGEDQILNMQEAVLNFSVAVGSELPDAAAFAGATLRMFGLQSSDTEDALDVLATATNKSALDFSYLSTAMSTVGPVAKTFGFSLRDTTALLGTLANAGFNASTAATATRNILLNLANANGKLAKSLGHGASNLDELLDGLVELKKQGIDLNTTLALTDKRSVAAFNTFLDGAEATRALRSELEDVGGAASTIATSRLDTVAGSVKLLQSAWEGFVLSFSNSKGAIKEVIDLMTEGIEAITLKMSGDARVSTQKNSIVDSFQKSIKQYGEEWTKNYMKQQLDAQKKLADQEKRANDNAPLLNKIGQKIQGKIATNFQQDRYQAMLEAYEQLFGAKTPEGNTPTITDGGDGGGGGVDFEELLKKQKKDAEKKRAEDIAKQATESQRTERENLIAHYQENLALLERYGLDTTDLTKQLQDKLLEIDTKGFEKEEEALARALDKMENDLADFDPDMSVADAIRDEFLSPMINAVENAKAINAEFKEAVVQGFTDGCQEMTDQLFGLSEINPGAIFQALLEPLADMAIREGEILMLQGAGVEACKKALESLNGYAAIAAGAALVAIGAAAKSGLKALANGGSRSTGSSTTYAGSGSLNQYTENTELTVVVTGKISGSDILLAGQRTQKALGR